MKTRLKATLALAVLLLGALSVGVQVTDSSHNFDYNGDRLSGAIFTTTENGDIVNENVRYESKLEVYLDGGPGQNAPVGAAALPAGEYVFQVTDPSGKVLLSSDHWSCRQVTINDAGVISSYNPGANYEKIKGNWEQVPCEYHNTGVDQDHAEDGAITVQLYPFDDTPNKGGVYKVWLTPLAAFTMHDFVPTAPNDDPRGENYQPGNYHGFIPRWSKTDNFKADFKGQEPIEPVIIVKKFHDSNANGMMDGNEVFVEGWKVDYTDPIGVPNVLYTTDSIIAPINGLYTFEEETPTGTLQTHASLDGVDVEPLSPTVEVDVFSDFKTEKTYEVVYGNVGLGEAEACKVNDLDTDGVADPDEPGIAGWKMVLTGTAANGAVIGPIVQFTADDGCTTFSGLLPGDYSIEEVMPDDPLWVSTSPMTVDFQITSSLDGSVMTGTSTGVTFTNFYPKKVIADFDTKGYWHNKNGLDEISQDLDFVYNYINTLDPYDSETDYFSDGDEPFDGYFSDGTAVEAAFNNDDGSLIWGGGTVQAEISHFLVNNNGDGGTQEQLAQQLLAFIFNVQYRLDGDFDAMIWDGMQFYDVGDLIQASIDAWASGVNMEFYKNLLDGFNNNDAVMAYLSVGSLVYPPITYS